MSQIDPKLLSKLSEKLGVTNKRVYALIAGIANEQILDRSHAALVLAARNGIGIQRYSKPEDRAAIRSALGSSSNQSPIASDTPRQSSNANNLRTKPKASKATKAKNNSIFVVHGRDLKLRDAMFAFLRALGLHPMEWNKAVLTTRKGGANPHVDDILDSAMSQVQAVVVMFSPDDLAQLKPSLLNKGEKTIEGKPKGQSRPNVLFEAGLALGRHPKKTLLVQVGDHRPISDIAGST